LDELDRLLRAASGLLGCSDVGIRCSCENLEVVYVEREDGRLLVTDRRETFQYLARGDDSTYDLKLLDEATAREICRSHGAELDASDEMFPRIQRELASPDDDVAAAVTAVAAAVDAVYRAATRPHLR
jgi:hypothetical protein